MKKEDFKPVDPFYQKRANLCIAQGSLTNSKRPECLVKGVYPTHAVKGVGSVIYDSNGKGFIDFICGLGSNILGYGNEEVARAIYQRALLGCTLSVGTPLEIEVAEKIREIFPFIERLKFLKTGTEACMAAIKIARAYHRVSSSDQNRTLVLSENYHGWSDPFVSLTAPHLGVPIDQHMKPLGGYEHLIYRAAAVIIEPISIDNSKERVQWLRELRDKCTASNTVLIFDEVITGFRFPKFCVSNHYGITPDLICLGKAMANGMPISVVGGRRDIMECGEYFVSSTFAGETVSLAAAMKTMNLIQTKFSLDKLWEKGEQFIKRFNELWPGRLRIDGYPTRGVFVGDVMDKALFWQEACRSGIIFGPSFFFNFAHIEHMDQVISTCSDIITRLKTGSVELLGQLPTSPFAQKMREQK